MIIPVIPKCITGNLPEPDNSNQKLMDEQGEGFSSDHGAFIRVDRLACL